MLSIITATFNKVELSQAYLASLEANSPDHPWELIWIDDGSTDGTRDWLKSLAPQRHKIILNERNLGFAACNNIGARAASGETLVLLNNDLLLTPGWFNPLHRALNSSARIGIVGNVQVSPATQKIDHAGVVFDLVGRPMHLYKGQPAAALKSDGRFCTAVTAACWMTHKSVFLEDAGGFDEIYRNGAEDMDLCLRLGRKNYKHWVDYRSLIYHHVSSSPGRRTHDLVNQAIFLKKWGETTSRYGQSDWPEHYLQRVIKEPLRLNGCKTIDALLRIAGLRHGDSRWAAKLRHTLSLHD